MFRRWIGMLILVPLLDACATVPTGPSVMVLPGGGKSFEQFQGDDAMCRQWAYQQAGTTPGQAANESGFTSALIGTVLGAAAGAAIGAAAGNPALGAAAGAGGGLLFGSAGGVGAAQYSGVQAQQRYGHRVPAVHVRKGQSDPRGHTRRLSERQSRSPASAATTSTSGGQSDDSGHAATTTSPSLETLGGGPRPPSACPRGPIQGLYVGYPPQVLQARGSPAVSLGHCGPCV